MRWDRLVLTIFLVGAPALGGTQHAVQGSWYGAVSLRGGAVTLRLDLTRSDSGFSGTMDIVESKLVRFPIPHVRFDSGTLRIAVPKGWGLAMFRDVGIPDDEQVIEYEGKLTGDGIVGTLRLARAEFPLTLRRSSSTASRVRKEDLTFANGDVTLSGTLYLPLAKHSGPFPVIVFTHGSGDRTRDAYASEAERIAASGVAAFVYDKRGAGRSVGANWTVATFDELASDAQAAVQALRARRDIDARGVGLFGLSQGTWLIGIVASRIRDLAFLVFVSGSGIPVWEQEIFRTGSMMRADGYSDSEVAEALSYQRTKFDVARTGLGWRALDSLSTALRQRPARWFEGYAQEYSTLTSARFWWLAAFHHDPKPILDSLTTPVLGMFGEKDLSFPISTVVANMRTSFARAGNRDVTLKVFAGAEHQLMVPQEHEGRVFRRAVTPEYLPTLITWLNARVGRRHKVAPNN